MAAAGGWKEQLLQLLKDRWAAREVFSLQEVYELAQPLAALHPENDHVEEKVRQLLQLLRDDGQIGFEDDAGHYSLVHPSSIAGDPVLREPDPELREALLTIRDLESQVLTSERLQGIVKGFGGQKGIYKPSGSSRALWVRQTRRGVYPDQPVEVNSDGSWTFRYSAEGRAGRAEWALDTNQGLLRSQADRIPVGVFRQVRSDTGKARYEILGLAYVTGREGEHFVLRGESNDVTTLPVEEPSVEFVAFEPSPRKMSHAERLLRDRRFSITIRRLYHDRCSLCNLGYRLAGRSVGMEAAHVIPVEKGGNVADSRNGLLLCRNHHALFDRYAWTINRDLEVVVAEDRGLRESAIDNHVLKVEGQVLPNLPVQESTRPASQAIDWRFREFETLWRNP